MIIADERIKVALGPYPELLLGLDSFAMTHGLEDRPGLVAQAQPLDAAWSLSLNFDDPTTLQRLAETRPSQNAYWAGLSRGTQKPSFGGVSFNDAREPPRWAFEARPDGHFIAGVFDFPKMEDAKGVEVRCIADFYAPFFADFLDKISRQFDAPIPDAPTYVVTATLLNASALHFAGPSDWGNEYAVRRAPLPITHLQWPVRQAVIGTATWSSLSADMGRTLTGAYGHRPYSQRP